MFQPHLHPPLSAAPRRRPPSLRRRRPSLLPPGWSPARCRRLIHAAGPWVLALALGLLASFLVGGPKGRPVLAQACGAEVCQDFPLHCATGHEYAALTVTNEDPEDRDLKVRYRWRQDGVTGSWSEWLTLQGGEDLTLGRCDLPRGGDLETLEVDGLLPGEPTRPVALVADDPVNRCAELPCGGELPGGSVALPAQCRSPRPFELATVGLRSHSAVALRFRYYWRVDGQELPGSLVLEPGGEALLASCDVAGAGRDVQLFALESVCRLDRAGRRCVGPAAPGDWSLRVDGDHCAAAACDLAEAQACERLVALSALPGPQQAEKGRVIVYQEAKKPGRSYPTVRFSAHWLVRVGDTVLTYPACDAEYLECGNISFKERRVILADFIVPVLDGQGCDGPPQDLIGLCLSPATDKKAGYKNFGRIATTVTSDWLLPCGVGAGLAP